MCANTLKKSPPLRHLEHHPQTPDQNLAPSVCWGLGRDTAFQYKHFCAVLFFNLYMYHFDKNLKGEKEVSFRLE